MTRLIRWAPGGALGLAVVAVWLVTGTPAGAVAVYLLTFLWSVTLPGVLVARALRAPASLLEDLAVGTTVGFALQLAGWAVFTLAGLQEFLLAWPLVVLVPFVAVASLRRHFRVVDYRARLHPASAWGLVAACLVPLVTMAQSMAGSHLPDDANAWYQDDYWHLALSAELMRSIPPDHPQVAGQPFFYHWFANAHVATMAHSSGIDLPILFARLWMPAVVFTGLAMIAVAGRALTGRSWPGVVAALMAGTQAAIWPAWFQLFGTSVFNVNSPSQQFSISLMMLALLPLLQVCRRGRLPRGDWAVLAIALVGAAGAKSSILPVLVCGLLLAAAVALLADRARLRGILTALALAVVVLLLTLPLTAGGSAGVQIQLLSSMRGTSPWALMLGGSPSVSLELLPPGLGRDGALTLVLLILAAYAVAYGWLIAGLRVLTLRYLEGWLLLGIGIAGWCAMMLLNQDGFSQVYFMSSAIIGWYLLTAAGAHHAWERAAQVAGALPAATAVVTGMMAGWFLVLVSRLLAGPTPEPSAINTSIALGLAPILGAATVTALIARGRPRVWLGLVAGLLGASLPQRAEGLFSGLLPGGSVTVHALAAVLGVVALALLTRPISTRRLAGLAAAGLAALIVVSTPAMVLAARDRHARPAPLNLPRTVTAAETTAARWVAANADRDDIVATNVHCLAKPTVEFCDARSFWVGAFTERRILLEGWAYTSEAHQAHGVDGRRYANQPFHDADLFALNEAAFAQPTREVLMELEDRGVRWLFADTAASPVSPELARLADEVFSQETVTVYRLR